MAKFSEHSRLCSAFILVLLLVDPEKAACATLGAQVLPPIRPGDVNPHGTSQRTGPLAPPGATLAPPALSQAETASVVVQATGSIEAGGRGPAAVPLKLAPKNPYTADSSVVNLAVDGSVVASTPASTPADANVSVNDTANALASAYSEADAGAEEDNATAAPAKGHVVAKVSSPAQSGDCRPDSEAASLTCCSAYTRTAARPGCKSNASWAEAKAACKAKGLELCSKAFIISGLGKGAGCPELDEMAMWTSEECVVSPPQVPAVTPASTPSPPVKGWVYVMPHNNSAAARERPEDSAFTYYQFEPLKVRGDEQVIEIAEIVLSNNGWQVSTSGATVSTPLGATDGILLIDGNVSSVWIDMKLEPITIKLPEPTSVDGFGFITGNVSARDPVRWKFRGSLDGFMWTILQDQAEDYTADVKRREIQGFVFGEQRPTSGAAERPIPATVNTTGGPNGIIYSDSLLNKSWTPADNDVTKEAATAGRQARLESAEQRFREVVGSGMGGGLGNAGGGGLGKEDNKPDTALVATLSTFGGIALLLAGGVAAYCMYTRPGADAAEQRDKAEPLLSARGD